MSQITQPVRLAGNATSRTWRAALVVALVAAAIIASGALVAPNGAGGARDMPFGGTNAAESRLDDYGLRHPAPFAGTSGAESGE